MFEYDQKNSICKECFQIFLDQIRCPSCRSPRIVSHKELFSLNIAHVDCDAFYASIEKSHNPEFANKPVIVGSGKRGIVTTCCYIARINGIKSAMPLYVAKKLCPNAIIIAPRMKLYKEVSNLIYSKMIKLTPILETVALDEAYLNLSGTFQLHGKTSVELLLNLAKEVENELNLSISIGLSENRFLAKLASSINKPRSFTVIGKEDKLDFIRDLSVNCIPGVGPSLSKKLKSDSIEKFQHLMKLNQKTLKKRYGLYGERLWKLAKGEDNKIIAPNNIKKSISKEITFDVDLSERTQIKKALWMLSENVSEELKLKQMAGNRITLKLKNYNFKLSSLSHTSSQSLKLAEDLFIISNILLNKKLSLSPLRLIGLSVSKLSPEQAEGRIEKSLDTIHSKKQKTELAIDKIRSKFGKHVINKGRIY